MIFSRTLLAGLWLTFCLAWLSPVSFGDEPKAKSFTLGLLPDTQFYNEKFPDTYVAQALWLREEYREGKLQFVIGLGDVVQNASVEQEWKNADVAAKILDGIVPYSIVPGNHDMVPQPGGLTRVTTFYRQYFPPSRYESQPWYGGHLGEGNDNNFCHFEAGGYSFLVISLEFCPSDEALTWAKEVIAKHPQHNVIVATHSYLNLDKRDRIMPATYKIVGNSGQQMWEKFIAKEPRIFLVVNGHFHGVNQQVSQNEEGQPVLEILTDYQSEGKGGDGWLRTMRFEPAENKIYLRAYSPLLKKERDDPKHTNAIDWDFSRLIRSKP